MRRGVIGYPLSHSYSKIIHEQLADYIYECIELDQDSFRKFMTEKKFDAINVTIPYKQQVIPYLDELDGKAKQIGAVNTIVNNNGVLKGYNTDYYGFKWLLENNKIDIDGKKVAILGNGGATKAIRVVINDMNVSECYIVSREKLKDTITYEELYQNHGDIEVIINATPVGMFPKHDHSPIDCRKFGQLESVVDIVYNPLRTQLLIEAEMVGCKTAGGLEMLVAQAKQAAEIFVNNEIDDAVIDQITSGLIHEKENIVFIGMPSSGKTTIAKHLAKQCNKTFVDIDEEVITKSGKQIKELFEVDGEDAFREIETQCILENCMRDGIVISCGGGVIKNEKNIHHLKKKGFLIWLDRDVNSLLVDDKRPLSSSVEAIKKLAKERIPLYKKAADIHITNNRSIYETINEIEVQRERRKTK